MKSIRSLRSLVVLTISLTASGHWMAQRSDVQPDKEPLVILIGRATNSSSLVRPDKLYGDGQNLPQPKDYRAGTIYKFHIDEVVKGNKKIRSGQTITILVPGPGNVSHSVWLSAQRTYLLQLSSAVDAEKYKGTVVMDFAQPSPTQQPFDSHDVFTVISDINSAVPITEDKDNKELIKRIRREAKRL